jgi:hypothetical protein
MVNGVGSLSRDAPKVLHRMMEKYMSNIRIACKESLSAYAPNFEEVSRHQATLGVNASRRKLACNM